MSVPDLLSLVVAAGCGVAVLFKFGMMLRSRPGHRMFWSGAVLTLGIGVALNAVVVARWIDLTAGVPGLAALLGCLLLVVSGSCCMLSVSDRPVTGRHTLSRFVVMVAAQATMIALFVVHGPDGPVGSVTLLPPPNPYLLVHAPYQIWIVLELGVAATRGARAIGPALQGLALRILGLVAVLAVLYHAALLARQGLLMLRGPRAWTDTMDRYLGPLLLATIAVSLTGVTLPAWGRLVGLEALSTRVASWWAWRRIQPLTTELRDRFPEYTLAGVRGDLPRAITAAEDGWRLLTEYRDPADAASLDAWADLHHLAGRRREVTIMAARIALGCRRFDMGVPRSRAPAEPLFATLHMPEHGSDRAPVTVLTVQARWLGAIADRYRDSALVHAIRRGELTAEDGALRPPGVTAG